MRPLSRRFALLSAGAALGLAAPASAQAALSITQHVLLADGTPGYIANGVPSGATLAWTRCAPDCGGAALSSESFFKPGPTGAGVSFQVSAIVDGTVVETSTSKVWGGSPVSTAPPTYALTRPAGAAGSAGTVQAGDVLTPGPGTWTGGWSDDKSLVGLRACPTVAGEGCVAMSASILQPGNKATVAVSNDYAGWFVGAIERRIPADSAWTTEGYPQDFVGRSPFKAPALSATVVAGPLVGPVIGVPVTEQPNTKPDPLGFTPKVTIRKRASKSGRQHVVATVSCPSVCNGNVELRQGKKTVSLPLSVTGTKVIKPPSKLSAKKTVRVRFVFLGISFSKSGSVKPA